MTENPAPTPPPTAPPIDMPPTSTTATRRGTSSRRRSPFLAPAAMGVLGVLAGGGLVAAIATDGESRVATTDAVTTVPVSADFDSTDLDSTDPDVSATSGNEVTATDAVTATTVNDQPLRPNAVRIAGTTYIETTSCVALPNSNPQFGIGDAHIAASMHRVEAADGQHRIIEQWSEDGFVSVAVAEPDGGYGRTDSVGAVGAPTGEPVVETVPMSGDRTVEVEHTLSFASAQCPSTIVQGADEFAFDAYGVLDVCSASPASGLGFIASMHGGSVLNLGGDPFVGEAQGRLLATFSDGTAVDATFTVNESNDGSLMQSGPIEAGALDDDRSAAATILMDLPISSRPCTADEESRFNP